MTPYEIEHSGIIGMRWGRRRYRNYDGTLTPEGKIRYEKNAVPSTSKSKTNKKVAQNIAKKKTISDMTDDELRMKTARLQLENNYIRASTEYRKLTAPKKNAIVSSGKKILTRAFEDVGTEMMKNILKKAVSSKTNMKFDSDDKEKDKEKEKK